MSELTQVGRAMQEIVRSRVVDAINYCEAYEGTSRTVVIDGTNYSPSWRALPYGDRVWRLSLHDPELAEEFEQYVDELEGEEFEDGWTIGWEDGILWAYAPWHTEAQ